MSETTPNIPDYHELDSRLRKVESTTAAITTTISSVGQDVSELKQMMQSFMAETTKIAELSAKVTNIDKVEKKVDDLDKKTDHLHGTFMTIQAEHSMCQLSKNRSEDYLRDLTNKISRLENHTQQTLTILQSDLNQLKTTRNRVDTVLWNWLSKAGWVVLAFIVFTALQHVPVDQIKKLGSSMLHSGDSTLIYQEYAEKRIKETREENGTDQKTGG